MKTKNKKQKAYSQTEVEKLLQTLCAEYLAMMKVTVSGIRQGNQKCNLPIGGSNLFKLLSGKGGISIKIQTQLLDFFGKKYELRIIGEEVKELENG